MPPDRYEFNAGTYESVTVATVAVSLTSGTYDNANRAELSLEGGQIRVRKDNTEPTTSEGHIVNAGDVITLDSRADIASFKAIRTGSVDGTLKATYSV